MSSNTKTLTILIGVAYLLLGLSAFLEPAAYLLLAPRSQSMSGDFFMFMGWQILIFGPCFFIGYAWVLGRKWGRYSLILYNGLWFMYMSYSFFARMIHYSESHLALVVCGFLLPLIVLFGLMVFAFREGVTTLPN